MKDAYMFMNQEIDSFYETACLVNTMKKSGFKLLFSMKYEKKSVTNLGVLFILTNEMYLECLQSLQI